LIKDSVALIRGILGTNFVEVGISTIITTEDVSQGTTTVSVVTSLGDTISGIGEGAVHALFNGFLEHYAPEYPSLNTLKIAMLTVNLKTGTNRENSGADAVAEVYLSVNNSLGRAFETVQVSRSIATSVALSVSEAVEFFINSEKAFVRFGDVDTGRQPSSVGLYGALFRDGRRSPVAAP